MKDRTLNIGQPPIPGVQRVVGQGIPVFLVHGHGVDHRILVPLDDVLDATGIFQRIYVDLPGMGQTEALQGAGGLPEIADWLEQLIGAQCGDRPFAMIGNSLGSLLVQEMADRFATQILGMALLAPLVFPSRAERTVPERRVLREDRALLDSLPAHEAEHYAQMAVIQSAENWQRFDNHVLPGIRAVNLRSMVKLSKRYFLNELPVHRANQLACPVVMICGKQDHITGFTDPMKLAARYPAAEIMVIPLAGHNVHLDQPERVAQHLTVWSEKVQGFFLTREL